MVVLVGVVMVVIVVGMAELAVEMSLVKVEVSKGASTSLPMLVSSSLLLVMSPTTSFGGTSVATLFSSIESVSIAELWVVVVGSGFSSTSFGKTNFFSLLDIFPENFDLVLALAEEVLSSIRTVTAFGGQKKEVDRYSTEVQTARKNGIYR